MRACCNIDFNIARKVYLFLSQSYRKYNEKRVTSRAFLIIEMCLEMKIYIERKKTFRLSLN